MRLVKVAELHRVIAQRHRCFVQSFGAVDKQSEISQVLEFEKSVFVFLKFRSQIHELLVMDTQITDVTSYVIEPAGRKTLIAVDYGLLHVIEFILIFFHEP